MLVKPGKLWVMRCLACWFGAKDGGLDPTIHQQTSILFARHSHHSATHHLGLELQKGGCPLRDCDVLYSCNPHRSRVNDEMISEQLFHFFHCQLLELEWIVTCILSYFVPWFFSCHILSPSFLCESMGFWSDLLVVPPCPFHGFPHVGAEHPHVAREGWSVRSATRWSWTGIWMNLEDVP